MWRDIIKADLQEIKIPEAQWYKLAWTRQQEGAKLSAPPDVTVKNAIEPLKEKGTRKDTNVH